MGVNHQMRDPERFFVDLMSRITRLERRLGYTLPDRLSAGSQLVTDWDDATESGFYWGAAAANSPSGSLWWSGLVIASVDGLFIKQFLNRPDIEGEPLVQVRNSEDGGLTWSAWESSTIPLASTTVAGRVELATNAETQAGTDAARAVTPAALASRTATDARTGLAELATNAEVQAGTDASRIVTPAGLSSRTATESRTGIAELATNAEVQAGADASRIVTPAGLSSRTATETRTGIIELATTVEAVAGTDASRAVTPAGLSAALGKDANVLWTGVYYMSDTQTANLSQAISAQRTGIICVWSGYSSGSADNYSWSYEFVPKWHVLNYPGSGINMVLGQADSFQVRKYIYVSDTQITGHAWNSEPQAANRVLRAVLGV